jgi:hypothetical protein
MEDKAARKIQHWFRAMKEAKSPVSTESSEPTTPQYSFRKQIRDESGRLVEEVINYGEIMNWTIVDIFGHLMFYDDLKKYARFPDETTYLTAEFRWNRFDEQCHFAVFTNTDSTDSYHTNGFYHGSFHQGAMSMEPFITLGQIESELENAEDEEREAESSETASPTSPAFKENHCQVKTCLKPFPQDEEDGKFICELISITKPKCLGFICVECAAIYGTTLIDAKLIVE